MIKSNEKKHTLKCVPNSPINSKIVDGYSNLNDGHLILKFKNDENKIEMLPTKTDKKKNITNFNYRMKDKGLSAGGIIAIVISCCIALLAVTALSFLFRKKLGENKNDTMNNSSFKKMISVK